MPTSALPGTLPTPAGLAAPVSSVRGPAHSPGAATGPNATLNGAQAVGTSFVAHHHR